MDFFDSSGNPSDTQADDATYAIKIPMSSARDIFWELSEKIESVTNLVDIGLIPRKHLRHRSKVESLKDWLRQSGRAIDHILQFDQATRDKPASLHGLDARELLKHPPRPRQWLVEGLIPIGEVTSLYADGGIGKTTLALQLAHAVTSRQTWLGLPVAHGEAIVYSAEDTIEDLHWRLDAMSKGLGCRPALRLELISRAVDYAALATLDRGRLVETFVAKELGLYGIGMRPRLIVIDSLAEVFAGNELDRSQATAFVRVLRRLAIKLRCAVVLIAHPSVSGMQAGRNISGSNAWSNAVKSRLSMSATDDGNIVLKLEKANRSEAGREIVLRSRGGEWFVAETSGENVDRLDQAKARLMELVAEYWHQSRTISPKAQAGNYAARVLAESDSRFDRPIGGKAMNALLREGRLRVVIGPPWMPPSRQVEFLEVVDALDGATLAESLISNRK